MGLAGGTSSTLVLDRSTIAAIVREVGVDTVVDLVRERVHSSFADFDPAKIDLRQRDGFLPDADGLSVLEWMPAMRHGHSAVLKVVGYNPSSPGRNLPSVMSTMQLYDPVDGRLLVVADAVFATAVRTGAASAVATRLLADPDSATLGIVGCGAQAVAQAHALARVLHLDEILVHDIDAKAAGSFARRVAFLGLAVRTVPLRELESRSDVICTATSVAPGKGPVLAGDGLLAHVHVNAVGSDLPGKTELPLTLLQRSVVCPDFPPQAVREGKCQQLGADDVGPSLFDLLAPGAALDGLRERLTVFDSTGTSLQDLVTMEILVELAGQCGLGGTLHIEALGPDPRDPYSFLRAEPSNPARSRPARASAGSPEPSEATESVLDLVARQVKALPEHPAVVEADRLYTFGELDRASDCVAHHLQTRWGVANGDVVMLLMQSSFSFVACMLGVLKSGAAYLPIDPAYPRARIDYIGRAAQATVQIVDGSAASVADGIPVQLVANLDLATLPPVGWRSATPAGSDAAYLIFTSGSTGMPKGIVQTHRCLANFVGWQVEASGLGRRRRVLQFAALTFDVSVQEIFYSLASGGCLVLTNTDLRRDPIALTRFVVEGAIEVVDFPPSWIHLLVELPETIFDAPSLAHVISAGEPLHVTPELRRLLERRPNVMLHNHYGPAETHMLASHTMSAAAGTVEEYPPVGRAISNMRAYILDAAGNPVADGVEGEVFIAGPGVARGYTDPSLDAGAFVCDPFVPGERMFRTRDRGRRRPDGPLEVLGRLDDMIKVRGYRIEPREVEARLVTHPDVRAASIYRATTPDGRDEVHAAIVGSQVAVHDLREHLAATLPAYMVPTRWWRVPELPRSPNSKIDRTQLPGPDAVPIAHEVGPDHAPDPLERVIRQVWIDVLELDSLGVEQDLFEAGCDSLAAVRGLLALATRTGVELRLRDLYARPTVAGLAVAVRTSRRAPPAVRDIADHAADDVPLSSCQTGIWLACQRAPDAVNAYAFAQLFHVDPSIPARDVRSAVAALVDRHQVLRTTFREIGGQPRQVVSRDGPLDFEVTTVPGADVLRSARGQAALELATPFDLRSGPLLRARLVIGEEASVLLLTCHHLVADAWSFGILERELGAVLKATDRRALGGPPVQYSQFARWQEQWLAGEECRGRVANVASRVTRGQAVALGRLRSERFGLGHAGGHRSFELDASGASTLAARTGGGLSIVIVAAFAAAIAGATGSEDLLFGTTVPGRSAPGLDEAVGPYAELAPLLVRVDPDAPVHALLSEAKNAVICADEDQMVPHLWVVDAMHRLHPAREGPLFDVGVQVVPSFRGRRDKTGSAVRWLETVWPDASRFTMWFAGVDVGDTVRFVAEHDPSCLDAAEVARHTDAFRDAFAECVSAPHGRIGDLLGRLRTSGGPASFGLRI